MDVGLGKVLDVLDIGNEDISASWVLNGNQYWKAQPRVNYIQQLNDQTGFKKF